MKVILKGVFEFCVFQDMVWMTPASPLPFLCVSSFSHSWRKRKELAEAQMQLGLPGHQLVTESATCWGSRLLMIGRVLEQERALAKVLSADKKTRPLVLTWQDIDVLEAAQKALKPLQDFTDALSGEEYVTLSYVRPALHLFIS